MASYKAPSKALLALSVILLASCSNISGGFSGTPEQEAIYVDFMQRCQKATGQACTGTLGGTSEVDVYGGGFSCRWRRGRFSDCSWY